MKDFNYKYLTPFKWFILENFPFIEADFDALTNWQLFCKIGNEMNKIINSTNTLGSEVENLSNAFIELKNYVDNYFNNLDIGDEVNKKLDEMVEDGTLINLLQPYMYNYTNVKTLGAKGDGVTDDTAILKEAIEKNTPLYFPEGTYIVSETLTSSNDVNWVGQGNKTIINSRPISNLNPNWVQPVVDLSASNNIRMKGFATTNSSFKIYPTVETGQNIQQLMRHKTINIENVTCDTNNTQISGKTNWQGMLINTPAPDNYTRDFHTGLYPRYALEIYNNSGYNGINIENRLYNEDGSIANVMDNSAIGIVDGVLSSAPALFFDMHGARNVINVKNRTGIEAANSESNPDSVFQVGFQGHLAIGCSVYNEDGALGVGTIKLKDNQPSIKFYDTNDSGISFIRLTNGQFQTISNGAVASYYDKKQNLWTTKHIYTASEIEGV